MSFASSLSSVEEEVGDLYLQLFHQAFEEPFCLENSDAMQKRKKQ
jgi:hypothetical protein